MKEPSKLMTMEWIVGCIQIENNAFGRSLRRIDSQEGVNEEAFDFWMVSDDLLVACGAFGGQLQPVERTLAGQREALYRRGLLLTREECHERIMTQLLVVIEVFIS